MTTEMIDSGQSEKAEAAARNERRAFASRAHDETMTYNLELDRFIRHRHSAEAKVHTDSGNEALSECIVSKAQQKACAGKGRYTRVVV